MVYTYDEVKMNRKKAHELISSLLCGTHKESSNNHYRDVALGVDKIYDSFNNGTL